MKKLSLLFLCVSALILAQNKRFVYEYKFVPDSTDQANIKTEMMFLDTSKDGSKYYSYTVFNSDSTMRVDLEQQLKATGSINIKSDMKKGDVRYAVSKKYPEYQTFLHTKLMTDSYKIEDAQNQNWKILPKKEKIGEWETQKAELDFGGRQWTAWFAEAIPIQDGPYKFKGLPGLIVKIEDKTGSHKMELKGIRNISEMPEVDVFKQKEIVITQKQYQKLLSDYEKDPTKSLKQMAVGNVVLNMSDGNQKYMKEHEERLKTKIKKDNNKIELKTN